MKKQFLVLIGQLLSIFSLAQINLSGTSYSQNFENLGSGLPPGWEIYTGATVNSLGASATLTTTPTAWSNATGAFKNFASANELNATTATTEQNSSTDRALGIRQTGTVGDPGAAFVLHIAHTSGLLGFSMSFKLQSLDAAISRQVTWAVDYGFGNNPASFTAASTVGNMITGNSSFTNNTITVNFGAALNNQTGNVWIRIVTLNTSVGSGSRPTTAIDNVNLSWSAGTPTLNAGSLSGFGNVCVNGISDPQSFNLTGQYLTTAGLTIGPLAGFEFATTSNGLYTQVLNVSQPGGPFLQTVFVKFLPTLAQSYNGNIPVTGGGANNIAIAASGTGMNSTTYYQDQDGDGFGNPLLTQSNCSGQPPAGYVSDNTDCNDNDLTVHSPQTYYLDYDGDGYSPGGTVLLCASLSPAGYNAVNLGFDCQDTIPTVTSACCLTCGGSVKKLKATAPVSNVTDPAKKEYCPGDVMTFSIPATTLPAEVCYYKWTAPAGCTILSGQGTTSVTISFNGGFTATGTVGVQQYNGCGYSPVKTMAVKRGVNKDKMILAVDNKDGICPGETRTYSATSSPGLSPAVTKYVWSTTVADLNLISGQGTNVAVYKAGNNYVGGGEVAVLSENACGLTPKAKTMKLKIGKAPKGVANVTANITNTGLCDFTTATFTGNGASTPGLGVPAFTYEWSLDAPGIGTVAGAQPQASNVGTLNFASGWNTGNVQVRVKNGCGFSGIKKLKVSAKPADLLAGSLIGPASLIVSGGSTGFYSTGISSGATGYVWTGPKGATLMGGIHGTVTSTATNSPVDTTYAPNTSIHVIIGAKGGVLKVYPYNHCATSKGASLNIGYTTGKPGNEIVSETGGAIQLFPNPSHDKMNVSFIASSVGQYRMVVYDAMGKMVMQQTGASVEGMNQKELDVSGLATGVYQLIIIGESFYNLRMTRQYKARFIVE